MVGGVCQEWDPGQDNWVRYHQHVVHVFQALSSYWWLLWEVLTAEPVDHPCGKTNCFSYGVNPYTSTRAEQSTFNVHAISALRALVMVMMVFLALRDVEVP